MLTQEEQQMAADSLKKEELVVGQWYKGLKVRVGNVACWDGQQFHYWRHKWGTWYMDTVNHFEDDNGYVLFFPIKPVDAPPHPMSYIDHEEG